MFGGDRSHSPVAGARPRFTLAAGLAVLFGAAGLLVTLTPSADAIGAQRSESTTSLVDGVRTLAHDAGAVAQSPVEVASIGLGSAALSPLSGVGPSTNAQVAEAAASLAENIPTPPTACPAPDSHFIDSWGAPRSGGRRHLGVDMMAPYGTPVLAPVDGVMRPHHSRIGGISYYLDGDDGNEYFGTHLQTVAGGGRVSAGEQIGTVGSTGNASTPHLHFEVKLGGMRSVNPYPYAVELCR